MTPFPALKPSLSLRPESPSPSHPPRGRSTRASIRSSSNAKPSTIKSDQSIAASAQQPLLRQATPYAQASVRHRDRERDHPRTRPETPLDFFQSMHRRVRSSMDSERLGAGGSHHDRVDQASPQAQMGMIDHPKGVPYSFPDDPSTGPVQVGSSSLTPAAKGASTTSAPGPSGTPVRRLGTLRESTRSKLASLSGFGREAKGDRLAATTDFASTAASSTTTSSVSPVKTTRPGLSGRSASFATKQTPASRPTSARHPSMYVVPTTPGLTDDRSVTTLDSTSSVAGEHDLAEDITLASSPMAYPASISSTQSSSSHRRERVMGLKVDSNDVPAGRPKTFVPQKMSDVVPFAEGHPFAAWDAGEVASGAKTKRRPSVTMGEMLQVDEVEEGDVSDSGIGEPGAGRWKTDVKGKKAWTGDTGVYRIGWERAVLDMVARVHEALWEVKESHTFAEFMTGQEPRTVLDIGTGTGSWPISQALVWPDTTFIGLDIVPCQTDLDPLVQSEKRARSTSEGTAQGEGMWEGLARRVTWDHANFLERLPYDDAVFDMVHMRFCGLGIPESKWYDLLEECARVLKKGGTLEIVEMAYTPPDTSPPSVRNAFASLLLAYMVQPNPLLPLQFNLPACEGLKATVRPTWERTFRDVRFEGPGGGTGTMGEAVMVLVRSALGYKGTGLKKGCEGEKVLAELGGVDHSWAAQGGMGADDGHEGDGEGKAGEAVQGTSVWAWVVKRR